MESGSPAKWRFSDFGSDRSGFLERSSEALFVAATENGNGGVCARLREDDELS